MACLGEMAGQRIWAKCPEYAGLWLFFRGTHLDWAGKTHHPTTNHHQFSRYLQMGGCRTRWRFNHAAEPSQWIPDLQGLVGDRPQSALQIHLQSQHRCHRLARIPGKAEIRGGHSQRSVLGAGKSP